MSITPVILGRFMELLDNRSIASKYATAGIVKISEPEEFKNAAKLLSISQNIFKEIQSKIDFKERIAFCAYLVNSDFCLAGIEPKESTFVLKFKALNTTETQHSPPGSYVNGIVFSIEKCPPSSKFETVFSNENWDVKAEPEYKEVINKRNEIESRLAAAIDDLLKFPKEKLNLFLENSLLKKPIEEQIEEIKVIIRGRAIEAMCQHRYIDPKSSPKTVTEAMNNCVSLYWELEDNLIFAEGEAFARLSDRLCGPLLFE